jgi:2',3'-cyclic-nucleotide 2'-phosphodiesterase / 3'-nucleotidase / 5'-nucleotidase
MKKILFKLSCLTLTLFSASISFSQVINLQKVGNYATGIFDAGATEIAAFDPATNHLFSVNGSTGNIDVIDISDVTNPQLSFTIDLSPYGGGANSVAFFNGVLVAAVEDTIKQNNGKAVFFDGNGNYINDVPVGALPDMVCFTPNGKKVLVANEGEPSADYLVDPMGTVSIISMLDGAAAIDSADVTTVNFSAYDATVFTDGTRVFGPGAVASTDFEPEYISVSKNSKFAYVTLQENNAIATINLTTNQVVSVKGLGFKDHSLPGNELDASDKNGAVVDIKNWPVFGMYMPDAIATVNIGGINYNITANEGDARDYTGFAEVSRVNALVLDTIAFPDSLDYKNDNNLGRLNVTKTLGDTDGDGDYDALYAFGARSFTIRTTNGAIVFDSGNMLETITNNLFPANFNCSNTSNTKKGRSDDKGPEPEGLAVATILDSVYLFLGLERIGGVMVFNISTPSAPYFVQYINDRDFALTPAAGVGGAQGPEGVLFIASNVSPSGKNLLVVSNEISGSISFFETDNTCGAGKLTVCYEGTTYCVKPAVAASLVATGGVYGSCEGERYGSEFVTLDESDNGIQVYPNPASETVQIALNDANATINTISIVDLTGSIVYQEVISATNAASVISVNISELPAGIYFVNAAHNAGVNSTKLIVD